MSDLLRKEADRRKSIKANTGAKFYFEPQKIEDVPKFREHGIQENFLQWNDWSGRQILRLEDFIEITANSEGLDQNLLNAVLYTEMARGGYDSYFFIEPFAETILPGNLKEHWQDLLPGSDIHNEQDNIILSAMLLKRISDRLRDPRPEDVYSLYNGLGHDRTYVNQNTKSTPWFMLQAMKATAWEKDGWRMPEIEPGELKESKPNKSESDNVTGDAFTIQQKTKSGVLPDLWSKEERDHYRFKVQSPGALTLRRARLSKPKPFFPISPPDSLTTGHSGLPKPKPANLFRPAIDPKTQAAINRGEAQRAEYKRKSDDTPQSDLGDNLDLQFSNRSDPLAPISGFEVPELQPDLNSDVLILQETQYKQIIDVPDYTPTPSKVRKAMNDCYTKFYRDAIDELTAHNPHSG